MLADILEGMQFGEDWDLWVAIANDRLKKGKVGGFDRIDEHLVEYRTHANGGNLASSFKAVSREPYEQMIKRSPEIFEHHFPQIHQSVLPTYLLGLKLRTLGQMSIKSLWSDNAHSFFHNKAASAKALLKKSVGFGQGAVEHEPADDDRLEL